MITVVNGYKSGFIGENKIYIGRYSKKNNLKESPLANPFVLSNDSNREEVISKYSSWLLSKLTYTNSPQTLELNRLISLVKEGKSIELVCYCKPKNCHGDIIKQIIEMRVKNES